jgi:zinc/manganese transport system substrate-binding protein
MNLRQIALIGLFAVHLAPASGRADDKLNVVATTPDLASLATAVGGDLIEVTAIARPTEDPHFVDARPSHRLSIRPTS